MELVRDEMNFIRLNGKTFIVADQPEESVDEALRRVIEQQEARAERINSNLLNNFVDSAFRLSQDEISRIVQQADRNAVNVPNSKHCLPLVVISNRLCPIRPLVYAPNKVYGSVAIFLEKMPPGDLINRSFWQMLDESLGYDVVERSSGYRSSHRLIITGTPPPMNTKQVMYAVLSSPSFMLCSSTTYHTIGGLQTQNGVSWHKMCIGNTRPSEYWALPDFKKMTNSVNMDSLASRSVSFDDGERHLRDICMQFLNRNVQHIAPEEEWNA